MLKYGILTKQVNTMKVIIENQTFDYDVGCRVLKLKYSTPFEGLEDVWDTIIPLSFEEICNLPNIENRRVAINCFGLQRIHDTVQPKMVDETTITKNVEWVLDGSIVKHSFNDVYRLFKVDNKHLNNSLSEQMYVQFKDTSTKREYLIWVNEQSVKQTNKCDVINAIQAIAWTFTTNIEEGNVKAIIRQGDCLIIYPNEDKTGEVRHLTELEYLKFLINES